MYPARFRYLRPQSTEEVLDALASGGPDVRVLAGGASLVPQMKYRQATPAALVDIMSIGDLRGIAWHDDHVAIGATTRHSEVADNHRLARDHPMVCEVASSIGDQQVRNMGTIGGGLAAVELAGDWAPALIALDGSVFVLSAAGRRRVGATDLFADSSESAPTCLGSDELIGEVSVPLPWGRWGGAHRKFRLRAVTSVGSVAVTLRLDAHDRIVSCSIGVGGFALTPMAAPGTARTLQGQELTSAVLDTASEALGEELTYHSDGRTTAAHRRSLAGATFRQALIAAHGRALGEVAA